MAIEKSEKTIDEIQKQMIELAEKSYNCSQILIILALGQKAKEDTGMVRAISGLADGCGFFNETCGVLTGAACLLSWYAGKGADEEPESEKLLPMLQDLGEWFRNEIEGNYRSTRCKDIVGDLVGTPSGKQICGRLLIQTYNKAHEILKSYGFT